MFLCQDKDYFFAVVAINFSKPHPRALEGSHIFLALDRLGSDVFVNYFSSQRAYFSRV